MEADCRERICHAGHSAMSRDTKIVAAWDFDRLIPCHGDVIETGAKQVWLDAFKVYLDN
jgi:hypothetical protein